MQAPPTSELRRWSQSIRPRSRASGESSADLGGSGCGASCRSLFGSRSAEFWHTTTSHIVKLRPHFGSSAGISLRLITGNLCITPRDSASLGRDPRPQAYALNPRTSRRTALDKRCSAAQARPASALSLDEDSAGPKPRPSARVDLVVLPVGGVPSCVSGHSGAGPLQ